MKSEKASPSKLRESARELRRMHKKAETLAHERWPVHDSDIRSFASGFRHLFPGGEHARNEKECTRSFIAYIEAVLQPKKHLHLKAVEFGGPGIRLFEGFPKGFFEQTLGVCLADTGNPIDRSIRPTHTIIHGDLFRKETYAKMNTALKEEKVDLILSRMFGALDEMTHDPVVWSRIARTWYGMLNEGGLMFVEYRANTADHWISKTEIQKDLREIFMKKWVTYIQTHFSDTLDVELDFSGMRLWKKPGAPKDLPVLPSFDRSPVIVKVRDR